MKRSWVALTMAGALALSPGARTASAAVVCPVCKSCDYVIKIGPIGIQTGHMNGCDSAFVDDFVDPLVPRHQQWPHLTMQGFTDNVGPTTATLDPVRPSHGVIQSQGHAEFPASNDVEFNFVMQVGGMTLVSNDPVRLSGTIGSIPPAPGTTYSLQAPVDFYQQGDPTQTTMATLLSSTVTIQSTTDVGAVAGSVRHSLRAWPNPADGAVRIGFSIPASMSVSVDVFDLSGRRVRAIPSRWMTVGSQSLIWDGRRDDGSRASNGVHFIRARGPDFVTWGRVVISR